MLAIIILQCLGKIYKTAVQDYKQDAHRNKSASLRNADLIAISALAEIAQAFAYDQQLVVDVQQADQTAQLSFR